MLRFGRFPISAMALLLLHSIAAAQSGRITITGTTRDAEGAMLPFATVRIAGTLLGDVSDRSGRYIISINRSDAHAATALQVRFVGYERVEIPLRLDTLRDDTLRIDLSLRREAIALNEVVVTTSAFGTGDAYSGTLKPLDVVTTPGAAADIFRALQTFPGVSSLQDGAGLYVRGGDVSETVMLLDQATLVHPYKYESPTGGMFGTIPPFLIAGTFFSSGGFPARYGNALSGALVMESMGLPSEWSITANVGLAASSLGVDAVLAPKTLGARFSGNRTSTDLLFRVNGRTGDFTLPPEGIDGNASLVFDYSAKGRLKLFNYAAREDIGVLVALPSANGVYRSRETNRIHNLNWSHQFGGWLLRSSLSFGRFDATSSLGALDLTRRDETTKLRFDLDREIGDEGRPWLRLYTGGEIERTENILFGTVPVDPGFNDAHAPSYSLDERYAVTRSGAHLEAEARLAGKLFGNAGVRVDHLSKNRRTTVDPRLSLRYQMSDGLSMRMAWGIYHQTPSTSQLNAASGNPDLYSQQARHLIIGAEYTDGDLMARLEGYDKSYRDLIVRDSVRHLVNAGDGRARGIDLFVKYGAFLATRLNGWLSYSLLDSRRLQVRDMGGKILYEYAPSPFDITHNLTIVAKYRVIGLLSVGATYRHATGAPITPVAGAILDTGSGAFVPVEGPVSSERLPSFIRLDVDISYYLPIGDNASVIFYTAFANLLDRDNILGYDYARDYSTRTPRSTHFNRSVYFGATGTVRL